MGLTAEDEVWAGYLVLLEIMKTGSTTFLAAGSYNPNPVMEASFRSMTPGGVGGYGRPADRA